MRSDKQDSHGTAVEGHACSVIRHLSPSLVLQKMEDFRQQGLFEPVNSAYNIILHVLAKQQQQQQSARGNSSDAAARVLHEGESILNKMLAQSQHNPLQYALYHPDAQTMSHIVELWTHSGRAEAHVKAEQYLDRLQQWYEQISHNPLIQYRPSPQLYCAVMEAHGRSNQPTAAYHRIMKLFEQMKATLANTTNQAYNNNHCSDENFHYDNDDTNNMCDEIAYTRTCFALANVRHPQHLNAYAAPSILDEICESALFSLNNRRVADSRQRRQQIGPKKDKVSIQTFLAVLTAYSRAGLADEAQQLLDYMDQLPN